MPPSESPQSPLSASSEAGGHSESGRPPHILLGISGGIAAYKSADLVRRLIERGAEVRVVMTRAAQAFITPLTLQALSGQPVRTDLLNPEAEAGMDHIALARWADQVLIAPATADLIARLACGLADDLLTTLVLATEAPLVIAPAMNRQMWAHPATQENTQRLAARGVRVIGPAVGAQACGELGAGRMVEPIEIAESILGARGPQRTQPAMSDGASAHPLAGRRVLMTVGPTREAIDPVRFIGNRSSGKMGYALAEALHACGAQVTMIAGPTSERAPTAIARVDVESAMQMEEAVMARVGDCELFVATAAVADYRAEDPAAGKIKKTDEAMTLTLVRNPDILAGVAALPAPPFTVGFAAETDDPEGYGRRKLEAKRLSMIAANRVGGGRGGFESDENALICLWPGGGRRELPLMSKPALATALADLIAERYAAQSAG
jgi:phosphopantothenoylcysteine decarboxylase/phosphopantothenate--cysteine ligase